MARLIIALDDEPDLIELLRVNLVKSGFAFEGYVEVESFWKFLETRLPDLILLDLMLPDMDGFEVFRALKSNSKFTHIPVIMLTARSEESDRILGLELGADDYVTKPFSVKELVARINAVLRRSYKKTEGRSIKIGSLVIDSERYEVRIGEKIIELTLAEFKVLELLASRPGRVFSRNEILNYLWGDEKIVIDRTVDVHISNLREKLGKEGEKLVSVRGVGYKISSGDKE